jgi:hypothetical protein
MKFRVSSASALEASKALKSGSAMNVSKRNQETGCAAFPAKES